MNVTRTETYDILGLTKNDISVIREGIQELRRTLDVGDVGISGDTWRILGILNATIGDN